MEFRRRCRPRGGGAVLSARGWLVAAFASLCGCSEGGAAGPNYRGEPLFTVSGKIFATPQTPDVPIRLGVAWYRDLESSSGPQGLETQDIEYSGGWPQTYRFSFFEPPPTTAIVEYPHDAGVARWAYGVLLAYEDRNGNGRLDPIPRGGGPIDHVMGTSIGDPYNGRPAEKPSYLLYVDGALPAHLNAYRPGYNLWVGALVPESTPLNIELQVSNELDFAVCSEFLFGLNTYELPCNIVPTGGLRVMGDVGNRRGVGFAALRVTDGVSPRPDALVEVNGQPVPFERSAGMHYSSSVAVPAPGATVVKTWLPGQPPVVIQLKTPGPFTLTTPSAATRFATDTPLPLQWTRSEGASFYFLKAGHLPGMPSAQLAASTSMTMEHTLPGLTESAFYEVSVWAYAPTYLGRGLGGSMVSASVSEAAWVDVIDPSAGVWLNGSVTAYQVDDQPAGGSVWVQGFDGLELLREANVFANQTALAFDPHHEVFCTGNIQLRPGETVHLRITAEHKSNSVSVTLPGDFELALSAPTVSASQPLTASWTSSLGAEGYNVTVYNESSHVLFQLQTLSLQAQLPALNSAGVYYVSVDAQAMGTGSSRHLTPGVTKVRTLEVTP